MKLWLGGMFVALMLAASASLAQNRVLVLQGGTLIDGTGKPPMANAVVVIQGTRITAVGRRGEVQIPPNANVINLEGRTILPGLIDSHTHYEDFHQPMFLHYGVTTILDKNSDPPWIMAQREGVKSGLIKGPRMFICGPVIQGTATGVDGASFNTKPVATVEEARAYVRSLLLSGVDAINIGNTVTDEQLSAFVQATNEVGVPLFGHTRNIRIAAERGYKFQEHMITMAAAILDPEGKTTIGLGSGGVNIEALVDPKQFPPLIDFMVKEGVYVNPTLVAQWSSEAPAGAALVRETTRLANDPQMAFVPAEVRELWKRPPGDPHNGHAYANIAEFIRQYSAAGGRVVVGTDAAYRTIPGLSVHYEMKMLSDAGVPPMKAIQAATLWNAQLILKEKDLGSVETGKLADFTIIEGDPLADITATQNVRMVIKEGQVIDTSYDPKWVNPIPSRYNGRASAITKVTPAVVRQGGQTVTLQIEGDGFGNRTAGFRPDSIVRFDNVDLPTKFVSDGKLTATLDAKLLQRGPGFYPLYVVAPGLKGTVSSAAYVVIDTADAPVTTLPVRYAAYGSNPPRFFGPTPRMAPQGGQTVTLEIEGTKFAPNAIVRYDTVDLPTKVVSSTKLTATLDAKLLQRAPGSYLLYVVNPGVYGTVSEAGYFMVNVKK